MERLVRCRKVTSRVLPQTPTVGPCRDLTRNRVLRFDVALFMVELVAHALRGYVVKRALHPASWCCWIRALVETLQGAFPALVLRRRVQLICFGGFLT